MNFLPFYQMMVQMWLFLINDVAEIILLQIFEIQWLRGQLTRPPYFQIHLILVIVAQNLDNTRLSLAYYTIFFIFQVLWTYSSWIVFLILFYFKYEDVPKWVSSLMYSDWEWRSMKRFWKCLCLLGKCFFPLT